MKRMFGLLVVLVVIYALISMALNYYSKGNTIEYNIDSFHIKEIYTNYDVEKDNYYFDITQNDKTYNLKVYKEFKTRKNVIKSIDFVQGNIYSCILPTFVDGNTYTDYKCIKDGIMYNYIDIKGNDTLLDGTLLNKGYEVKTEDAKQHKYKFIYAYPSNLEKNHVMLVSTYKGYCVLINEGASNLGCNPLFTQDAYTQNLKIFTKNYYVVADYNQTYDYDQLYYYNLKTGDKGSIKLDEKISFNSFIQGYVDNTIYIVDKDKKKQYTVNLDTKYMDIVCDGTTTCKIIGDEVTYETIFKIADENIKFTNNNLQNKVFYSSGNEQIGFSLKVDNNVVYKIDHQNPNIQTYAFTMSNYFVVADSYAYYIYDDSIYLYGPNQISKKIFTSRELTSNNIYFNVYAK